MLAVRITVRGSLEVFLSIGLLVTFADGLIACSICTSVSPTICDEINAADLAVIARYESTPEVKNDVDDPDAYKSVFHIETIIKGKEILGSTQMARVLFFPGQSAKRGDLYLMHGNLIEADDGDEMIVRWTTPIAVTDSAIEYIGKMQKFPEEGPERLVFAKEYLTRSDKMLRRDAFDEFGKAPYDTLIQLKPLLHAGQLINGIEDAKTSPNIRKLYYTLLSICGSGEHVPFLKSQIDREKSEQSEALPAMIACYLSLTGSDGLAVIERAYLRSEETDDARRAGAAITALRFHGQEAKLIDREQIAIIFRNMLERPQLGARVLSDLARWEDWSIIDQVAELFVTARGDSLWVREPAVRYLIACPLPEAKKQLERLAGIDAAAVRNGRRFAPVVGLPENSAARGSDPRATQEPASEGTARLKITESAEPTLREPPPQILQPGEPLSVTGAATMIWVIAVPATAGILFMVLLLMSYKLRDEKL